jgi:hypothetical protein
MPHSSLSVPFTWEVQPVAVAAPRVHALGSLGLMALSVLCMAWLVAMVQDVWLGVRSAWWLAFCLGVAWLWGRQSRRAWSRWHAVQPMQKLSWGGVVTPGHPQGGWRLGGPQGDPAELRCRLDVQGWLLCQILVAAEGARAGTTHWFWITSRLCPDLHLFRTLMTLPVASTTASVTLVEGASDARAGKVASWSPRRQATGITLRASSNAFKPTQPMSVTRGAFRGANQEHRRE